MLTTQFESETKRIFAFLESEYSLVRSEPRVVNPDAPKDAYCEVRYCGKSVDVRVIYGLGSSSLNVQFIHHSDVLSRKTRTIDIESYVEFLTGGKVPRIIPMIDEKLTFAEMCRRSDARQNLVEMKLPETLQKLAAKVRAYGRDVLSGDPSVFERYHAAVT